MRERGLYEQAEPLLQRALTIREQMLGPEHPDVGEGLNNLASVKVKQGKYEQAEPLYQRALAIHERVLGPEHPKTCTVHENYASLTQAIQREGRGTGRSLDPPSSEA